MKTLTGSGFKLYSLVKDNDAAMLSSRLEPHFLGCAKKNINVGFSQLSVSWQRELIHPIFSASALSSSSDTQTQIQDEEMQVPDGNQYETVHVKFQLQKQCMFGQHFFIVGDDPIFGLWDPSRAIPMNWSDGHVWTVELDIPIGRLIKYKFILKGGEDTILWQPGDDRVLQAWETRKMITVIDDWDNSKIQNIIEEEPVTELPKEYAVDPELLMVAQNLTQSSEDLIDNADKELSNASSYSVSDEKSSLENHKPTIASNTTEQKGEELEVPSARTGSYTKKREVAGVDTSESSGRAINGENLLVPDSEMNLVYEEEFPVLVPGLTPVPTLQTEELFVHADEENAVADISLGSDNAEELNLPELKDEAATETSCSEETTTMASTSELELQADEHIQKPQLDEGEDQKEGEGQPFTQPQDNNFLEGDIQWGRRTLQKFLTNFGLL